MNVGGKCGRPSECTNRHEYERGRRNEGDRHHAARGFECRAAKSETPNRPVAAAPDWDRMPGPEPNRKLAHGGAEKQCACAKKRGRPNGAIRKSSREHQHG